MGKLRINFIHYILVRIPKPSSLKNYIMLILDIKIMDIKLLRLPFLQHGQVYISQGSLHNGLPCLDQYSQSNASLCPLLLPPNTASTPATHTSKYCKIILHYYAVWVFHIRINSSKELFFSMLLKLGSFLLSYN